MNASVSCASRDSDHMEGSSSSAGFGAVLYDELDEFLTFPGSLEECWQKLKQYYAGNQLQLFRFCLGVSHALDRGIIYGEAAIRGLWILSQVCPHVHASAGIEGIPSVFAPIFCSVIEKIRKKNSIVNHISSNSAKQWDNSILYFASHLLVHPPKEFARMKPVEFLSIANEQLSLLGPNATSHANTFDSMEIWNKIYAFDFVSLHGKQGEGDSPQSEVLAAGEPSVSSSLLVQPSRSNANTRRSVGIDETQQNQTNSAIVRILKQAQDGILSQSEETLLREMLATCSQPCINPSVFPESSMLQLIESKPSVAAAVLLCLLPHAVCVPYLQVSLLSSPMTLHGMEVVSTLIKEYGKAIPGEFLRLYINHCIDCCLQADGKFAQSRKARLLCVFLLNLVANGVFDSSLAAEVYPFCLRFRLVKEASQLYSALKRMFGDSSS